MPQYIVVKERSSLTAAALWMIGLSILLVWMPFGQFIAGLVGGKKAGNLGRAIGACIVASVIVSIAVTLLFPFAVFFFPVVSVALIAANSSLLIGAIIGGLLA